MYHLIIFWDIWILLIKEFFDEPKTVGSFMLILLSPEFLRLFLFMELINGLMFVFVFISFTIGVNVIFGFGKIFVFIGCKVAFSL